MKHALCFIIACAAISTLANAQIIQKKMGAHQFSNTNFVDTIPIEFCNNRVIVPVEIHGTIRRFLLDTGYTVGGINTQADLVPNSIGNQTVYDVHGKEQDVNVAILPDFKIGRLIVKNYTVVVTPPMIHNTCLGIVGVLGFNLLNGLSAKIDTKNRILIITDRKNFFEPERNTLKYKLINGIPVISVSSIGGYKEAVVLDTGSDSFYRLGDADKHYTYFSKKVDMSKYIKDKATGSWSAGVFGQATDSELYLLQLDEIKWGDYAFKHPTTVAPQKGRSGIGADILNYGSLIINTPRKKISFQPFDKGESCMLNNTSKGMTFNPTGGTALVSLVWEKSEAYQKGVRKGDIVLQIDDTPIDEICTLMHLLQEKKGKEMRFLIKSEKGDVKEIVFQP